MIDLWKTIKQIYEILQWVFLLSVFYKPCLHFIMESTNNHTLLCKLVRINIPLLLHFVPPSSGNVMTPQLQLGTLVCITVSKADNFREMTLYFLNW